MSCDIISHDSGDLLQKTQLSNVFESNILKKISECSPLGFLVIACDCMKDYTKFLPFISVLSLESHRLYKKLNM